VLIPQDHRDDFLEILQRIRRGENIAHYETVRERKDRRPVNICLDKKAMSRMHRSRN
jgi:hypothetical protein